MQKYPFLRLAATIFRVLGWIVLVVGIIGSIVVGIMRGGINGALIVVMGIIYSFLAGVFLLAVRELFYLFIDVEENTRNTAERIAK